MVDDALTMLALELPGTTIELLGLALILAVGAALAARELRKGIKLHVDIDDKRDDDDQKSGSTK